MSRSKNELLLIALALFVMACVFLYQTFNPSSLMATEVVDARIQTSTQEQQTTKSDISNIKTDNEEVEDLPDSESDEPIGIININTASLSELTELEGIGETKAQAIIDYRDEHDGFSSVDELMSVDGIGEKTFEKIKDNICI